MDVTGTAPIEFVISPEGDWLRDGLEDARARVGGAGAAALRAAAEEKGLASVSFSRDAIRLRLHPRRHLDAATASLRPRLAAARVPVFLEVFDGAWREERCADGLQALVRIEELRGPWRALVLARAHERRGGGATELDFTDAHAIAGDGSWFAKGDPALAEAVGFADPAVDAVAFAVVNMGWLETSVEDGRRIVRLRPRLAEPRAVRAAARALHKEPGPAAVRWLGEGWAEERFDSGPEAARRICALCGVEDGAGPGERWRLVPRGAARLLAEPENPLRLMLQKWRVSFGAFSDDVIPFALGRSLGERLILTSAAGPGRDLVFRYIGSGMSTLYPSSFLFGAAGRRVEDQPDRDYGLWLAAAYRRAADAMEPQYDFIEAHLPDSARGPWLTYERLLLPWKGPRGEVFVSMHSRINQDRLPLRPGEVSEPPSS